MIRTTMSVVTVTIAIGLLLPSSASAQRKGPPPDFAKNAFQMVLSEADKNGDGKLAVEECFAMWKDGAVAEKNCKHWDTDADGIITEEEYVDKATQKVRQ